LLSFFEVLSDEELVDDESEDDDDESEDDDDEEDEDAEVVSFSFSLGLCDPLLPPRLSVL
jgi:hypothetical protein